MGHTPCNADILENIIEASILTHTHKPCHVSQMKRLKLLLKYSICSCLTYVCLSTSTSNLIQSWTPCVSQGNPGMQHCIRGQRSSRNLMVTFRVHQMRCQMQVSDMSNLITWTTNKKFPCSLFNAKGCIGFYRIQLFSLSYCSSSLPSLI